MDRFSEQLISKCSTGKDILLRILIVLGAFLLSAAVLLFLGSLGMTLIAICLIAGVVWAAVWLFQGTFVEYEYIVTNDDLDIDKIIGRRKRRRLITLSLNKAKELTEYSSEGEINADITVMAHDESGDGIYCFICETKKYGNVAVLFNPDKRTLYNMIGGFSPSVRAKYGDLYKKVTPVGDQTDTDEDTTDNSEAESAGTQAAADESRTEGTEE